MTPLEHLQFLTPGVSIILGHFQLSSDLSEVLERALVEISYILSYIQTSKA